MKLGVKSHCSQFINVGEEMEQKRKINNHRVAVDVIFAKTEKIPRYSQMHAKKGINIFGQWIAEEMLKEYEQTHETNSMGYMELENLTVLQNIDHLLVIKIIKEKKSGKIKGRTCADGRLQRKYIPRGDITSHTIYQEVLMASLDILPRG